MNRFLKEKFIAFTLAEMMVILALFSTIAAATLPVVTARRALDTSELATGGATIDPWTYSSAYNGLSYNSAKSALAGTAAVMIGGQVSADAYSLGYPQLIIRDVYGTSSSNYGNHIVFIKRNSSGNTYLGGNISMGKYGSGNIAIGANTMIKTSVHSFSKTVAIGSYAFNGRSESDIASVGIGYGTGGYSGQYNIALGYQACQGYGSSNVCIGPNAGADYKQESVMIGLNAGNAAQLYGSVAIGTGSIQNSGRHKVAIGYNADGNNLVYSYSVSIGSNAGYAGSKTRSTLIGLNTKTDYENSVVIGTRAQAYSTSSPPAGAIVIGNNAGYGFNYKNTVPVLIGNHAGASSGTESSALMIDTDVYYPVIIGYNALGKGNAPPLINPPDVAIGAYSGYITTEGGLSGPTQNKGSVFIGNHAGYDSEQKRAVCIGNYTCAADYGESVVRIAPYGYYYYDSKHLAEKTSFIGNPSLIAALDSATRDLFVGSSTYSNMLISPAITASDVASSSIVFYANTVYGPSSTFKMFSDKNLKNNIKPAKYGLKDINKINIYEYNLKEKSIKKRQIGVIAQEMQEIIPEGVKQLPSGYYTVNADWLIFPMVNAIKELDKTFMALKSDLTKYFNEYIVLVSRVNALEKEVKTLELENKSLTKNVKIAYKKAKIAERRQ